MIAAAAALIGAGMLAGGATLESFRRLELQTAGMLLAVAGAVAALVFLALRARAGAGLGFVLGAIVLMGGAMHLAGVHALWTTPPIAGLPAALLHLYSAALLLALGWLLDVRLVTALAIIPFAQALDTGTFYGHAVYVFYSPEPTLSVLQMTLALIVAMWLVQNRDERTGRHAGIFGIMAFIVGNLSFLVGSLWGDVVGESWVEAAFFRGEVADWDAYYAALEAYRADAFTLSANTFSVIWAVALALAMVYALYRGRRGLFNAALTFAAIHAYTQAFESFYDQPLAYVIGGLAAIPMAWGIWRANDWFAARAAR